MVDHRQRGGGAPRRPSTDVAVVDVLLGVGDARRILPAIGTAVQRGRPSARFRSDMFARASHTPLVIEFMAGFHHFTGSAWRPVAPLTRQPVDLNGVTLFVPDRSELIAILTAFARPKDLKRARLLEAG